MTCNFDLIHIFWIKVVKLKEREKWSNRVIMTNNNIILHMSVWLNKKQLLLLLLLCMNKRCKPPLFLKCCSLLFDCVYKQLKVYIPTFSVKLCPRPSSFRAFVAVIRTRTLYLNN